MESTLVKRDCPFSAIWKQKKKIAKFTCRFYPIIYHSIKIRTMANWFGIMFVFFLPNLTLFFCIGLFSIYSFFNKKKIFKLWLMFLIEIDCLLMELENWNKKKSKSNWIKHNVARYVLNFHVYIYYLLHNKYYFA